MSAPTTITETDSGHGATAVLTPPAPPAGPPATGIATGGEPPRRKRAGAIAAVVLSIVALLLVGGIVWLVMWSTGRSHTAANSPAIHAAFDSAMKKAGVKATYPAAPVGLTTVVPTGSHDFAATFTPDEVGALLDTFMYTASVAGTNVAISDATVTFPAAGTIRLQATVTANGSSYSGDVTVPASFTMGEVRSSGVTALTVEGITPNDAQKSQVSDALVMYANSILGAAPGLKVHTAIIEADGVHVTGTAPDSITYP